jgi:hypothetical protein
MTGMCLCSMFSTGKDWIWKDGGIFVAGFAEHIES